MSGLEGLLTGRSLAGRYRVQKVIGRGGMGAVYLARDERLGREVALKVITATAVDPEAAGRIRRRFQREAAAAARLPHHPNVVPVYDFGTDPALQIDFLVMELLRGQTLQDLLARQGRLAPPEAVSVLRRAARGIAVGHRAGIVHRDVKPGNIFLVRGEDGETGVRVLDFGIAKVVDEEESGTQLTHEGGAPHSPAYASPEQLRALPRLTPAADVFSLGVVGFQILTGQRPFSEEARNRLSLGMPVPVPSARSIDDTIPASLDAVLRRAMAYDPDDRFASASDFGSALRDAQTEAGLSDTLPAVMILSPAERLAADETVAAGEVDDADETRAFADDADGGDETLAAAEVESGPDMGDRTLAAPPPGPGPGPVDRPAPAPVRRRRKNRAGMILPLTLLLVAIGFAGWYLLIWEDPAPAPPPPPEEVEVEVPEIDDPVGEEPDELQAWVLNNEGVSLLNRGRIDEAIEHFRRASEISPDVSEYRYNHGNALVRAGEHAAAIPELEAAIRLEPRRANAYALYGQARLELGDTTMALESFRQFLERGPGGRERQQVERQIEAIEAAQLPQPEPEMPAAEPDPDPEAAGGDEARTGHRPGRSGSVTAAIPPRVAYP